jgi:hypothetical protein
VCTCVHRDECSYVNEYLCLYCVSQKKNPSLCSSCCLTEKFCVPLYHPGKCLYTWSCNDDICRASAVRSTRRSEFVRKNCSAIKVWFRRSTRQLCLRASRIEFAKICRRLAEVESDLLSHESLVRFSHGLFRFDRLLLLEP